MAMNKLRYKFEEEADNGCERSFFVKHTLDRGINESGVLHWEVPADSEAFTDTPETYICVELRVVHGDGSNLKPEDKVFLTPGSLQSLFSTCTVSLNGHALPVNTHYSQAATLVSYIVATKNTRADVWSSLSGWSAPLFNSSQLPTPTPIIYTPNNRQVAGSRLVTLYGRLASDFCMSCAQLVPPGMKMEVLLTRQPAAFSLCSGEGGDFKVMLQSASLFVKRVVLCEPIRRNVLSTLATSGGLFRYNRLSTILMPVAKESLVFRWNNAYNSGPLPHSLYMVLLSQKAFYGDITCLSNYYETGGVKKVSFVVNGRPVLAESYSCKFSYDKATGGLKIGDSSALGAFLGLTTLVGSVKNLARPVGISYNEFLNGCTIFTAQLNTCGGKKMGTGALDVELEFAGATKMPLLCLCFGEFDSAVHFDGHLNIL